MSINQLQIKLRVKRKKIHLIFFFPGKIKAWCWFLSPSNGCILEMQRFIHRFETGLQVQRARNVYCLCITQPLHSCTCRRRGYEYAESTNRNMVRNSQPNPNICLITLMYMTKCGQFRKKMIKSNTISFKLTIFAECRN